MCRTIFVKDATSKLTNEQIQAAMSAASYPMQSATMMTRTLKTMGGIPDTWRDGSKKKVRGMLGIKLIMDGIVPENEMCSEP